MTTLLPKQTQMIALQTQEMFERLIGRIEEEKNSLPLPPKSLVYFTANWCGACKKLDLNRITSTSPDFTWFKCDIDENDYTAGFCEIRQIPTFLMIKDKKIVGRLSNSHTDTVCKWIRETV